MTHPSAQQPQPPRPPVPWHRRKWVIAAAAFVVWYVAAAFAAPGDDAEIEPVAAESTPAAAVSAPSPPAPEPRPDPAVAEDPNADLSANCDYLLGDFSESEDGFRFVAGGEVENAGNVGVEVRVTGVWQLLGERPIRERKVVRVEPNRSKRFNISHITSSDEISAHQSADSECDVNARIVDTFGQPQ